MNRLQAAEQMRKALRMYINSLPVEQALEFPAVYDSFKVEKEYRETDRFYYGINNVGDPQLYQVVKNHISNDIYLPGSTPSLYTPIGLDENGHPLWAQPSGAHDAYDIGDIVNYKGTLYESKINGNVWSPELYSDGWELYNDEPPVEEWSEWKQPSGAHDAYKKGDKVSHNGHKWISDVDANTWEPGIYGWTQQD